MIEVEYTHTDIMDRLSAVETKLEGKQDKISPRITFSLLVLLAGQIFAYGMLYNRVDVAMNNRYTSADAVRDMALIETRFEHDEEDIRDLEDVDKAFGERIRELEQRTLGN